MPGIPPPQDAGNIRNYDLNGNNHGRIGSRPPADADMSDKGLPQTRYFSPKRETIRN